MQPTATGIALSARQTAHVAGRLRELRLMRQWSMRALAGRAGISSGMVSALERGECQPSLATMLALQAAFDLPSIELLLGHPAATASQTLIGLRDTGGAVS